MALYTSEQLVHEINQCVTHRVAFPTCAHILLMLPKHLPELETMQCYTATEGYVYFTLSATVGLIQVATIGASFPKFNLEYKTLRSIQDQQH